MTDREWQAAFVILSAVQRDFWDYGLGKAVTDNVDISTGKLRIKVFNRQGWWYVRLWDSGELLASGDSHDFLQAVREGRTQLREPYQHFLAENQEGLPHRRRR